MNSASLKVGQVLSIAAALAATSAIGTAAFGATYNWIGPSGDDWNTPADWTTTPATGTIPQPADIASFNLAPIGSPTVLVTAPTSIQTLNFEVATVGNYTIGTIGDGGLIFGNAGSLNVNSSVASGRTETIASSITAGTGSVATTFNINNNSGNSPTLNIGTAGTTSTFGAGTTGGAVVTLNLGGNSGVAINTINDVITDGTTGGVVGITRNGTTHQWFLTNPNSTYSGPTLITPSGGNSASSMLDYTVQGALYNNNSAITVQGGGVLGVRVGTAAGKFTDGASGAGTLGDVISGTLAGGHAGKGALTWSSGSLIAIDTTDAGGSFTYNTAITDHAAGAVFGVAKVGSGTLIIPASVTNTYTGFTTFGNAGANCGTLQIDGSNNTAGQTVITGNQGQNTATTTTLVVNNAGVGLNGGLASGLITMAGGILSSGPNLSGGLTLANNISVSQNSTFGGPNSILVNGSLSMTSFKSVFNVITGVGNTLTLAGTVSAAPNGGSGGIGFQGTGTTIVTGNIQSEPDGLAGTNPTVAAQMNAGSSVTFSHANTYTGTTNVNAGILIMNNASNGGLGTVGTLQFSGGTLQSALPNQVISNNNSIITGSSTVSGSNAITINGTFTNSGGNRTLTSSITGGNLLTLAGNVYLSEATATGRTFTLGGTGNTVISQPIANFNGAGTAGNFTVTNTGITKLNGGNTYTGNTTISPGAKVLVNGTTVGQGNYAITANASNNTTLAGTGTINLAALATLTATGFDATHAAILRNGPMDGVNDGYFTINNTAAATLATFAQVTLDMLPTPSGGSTPYYLTFAGPLSMTGLNTTLNINDLGGALTQPQYNLISTTGWTGGTGTFGFANITYNGVPTTFTNVGGTGYDLSTDNSHFTLVAVPEPASVALLGLAGLLLLPRRRRVA